MHIFLEHGNRLDKIQIVLLHLNQEQMESWKAETMEVGPAFGTHRFKGGKEDCEAKPPVPRLCI